MKKQKIQPSTRKQVEKAKKQVEFGGVDDDKLTQAEQEVLYLLTKEYLTVKQAAIRRRCSNKNIYKIWKNLRKKGVITEQFEEVEKSGCAFQPDLKKRATRRGIRLHGVELHFFILSKDERYFKILQESNIRYVKGNTVKLSKDAVEVYLAKSWFGDDAVKAWSECVSELRRIIAVVENDLKIILVKSRCNNIKVVKWHFAEMQNEIARDCEVSGDKIRVYAEEDGKLWFVIDNSFNLHEAETQHIDTGLVDMQVAVAPRVNDWRRHPETPLLSEIWGVLAKVVKDGEELNAGLHVAVKLIGETQKQIFEVTQAQLNTNVQLQGVIKLITPVKPVEDDVKDKLGKKPNYIG